MLVVNTNAAIKRLMRFLAIEGVTGRETMIGKVLVAALREAGVPPRSIRFDDARDRIPLATETGNLMVDLAGRGALKTANRLLFMTHMDTVARKRMRRCSAASRQALDQTETSPATINRTTNEDG